MIGRIVNYRYEVLEKIGDGEFFSVYRARDKVLNRLVALKVLNKDIAENNAFAEAVKAGYEAVVLLAHPDVARVVDADLSAEECYVACEYVRGINVKERIKKGGPIAVPLALDIIIPTLEALEYAHANKIVHGDIRPQDIIVSPDGEVKVTDFGFANALYKCPEVADKHILRSVHYQAPEIAEGVAPNVLSDLYSVGVVLYEMVTGTLPFEGPTAVAVALKKIKESPLAPRTVNTAVPKSLSDVIMRLLDKNPEARYPSASAVLADLRAIREALMTGKPTIIPQPITTVVHAKQDVPEPAIEEPQEMSVKKTLVYLILLFVVTVFVSMGIVMLIMGRGEVIVPKLVGLSWDEAQGLAREAGLQLRRIEPDDYSDYPVGQIYFQSPGPERRVASGSEIQVKVSKGPRPPEFGPMPNVKGMSEPSALEVLRSQGFQANVKREYSDSIEAGYVISQDPRPDVQHRLSEPVSLVISLGRKPEKDEATNKSERTITVPVEVPSDLDSPQEVRIEIIDENGQYVAYQKIRNPGESFTANITTKGEKAEVKVYIGGQLASDQIY